MIIYLWKLATLASVGGGVGAFAVETIRVGNVRIPITE